MHRSRLSKVAALRRPQKFMTVRMNETRMVFFDKRSPTALIAGSEYALPIEFATFLLMEKRAVHVPGRLPRFRKLKELRSPVRKERVTLKRVLTMED